jgi:hypothetical protein
MAETLERKPPLPLSQAFVACHEIYRDERTGMAILVGPISHVPITQFPAHVRVSIFAEFSGGHGRYHPRLCLMDGSDEAVWGWNAPAPVEQDDPLLPHQVTFHDVMLAVPRVGRYRLVLLLNGEELAQRGLWLGPTQAFRGSSGEAAQA